MKSRKLYAAIIANLVLLTLSGCGDWEDSPDADGISKTEAKDPIPQPTTQKPVAVTCSALSSNEIAAMPIASDPCLVDFKKIPTGIYQLSRIETWMQQSSNGTAYVFSSDHTLSSPGSLSVSGDSFKASVTPALPSGASHVFVKITIPSALSAQDGSSSSVVASNIYKLNYASYTDHNWEIGIGASADLIQVFSVGSNSGSSLYSGVVSGITKVSGTIRMNAGVLELYFSIDSDSWHPQRVKLTFKKAS